VQVHKYKDCLSRLDIIARAKATKPKFDNLKLRPCLVQEWLSMRGCR